MELYPFQKEDGADFLRWVKDEAEFDLLSGGTLGKLPKTGEEVYRLFEDRKATELRLTAKKEGVPVGQLSLRRMDDGSYRVCYVILDQNRRKEGLGQEMMQAALAYCQKELHCTTVSLVVFQKNAAAFHCYQKVGFQVVEGKESVFPVIGKEEVCYEMVWSKSME